MTEQEKLAFELEIREKIAEEKRVKQREYMKAWRKKNSEYVKKYDRARRARKKMCKEVSNDEQRD